MIIGVVEKVKIVGNGFEKEIMARIDTGASKNSIDMKLASKLKMGPVIQSTFIKSAHGSRLRPVIEGEIEIKGKKLQTRFTMADRSHMKYPVLIGRDVLKEGFLIDPSMNNHAVKK